MASEAEQQALQRRFQHKIDGEYFYDGILFEEGSNHKDILATIKNLELRDGDILIDTYPKSGTTWMLEIVTLILAKGDKEIAHKQPIQSRCPFIELHDEYKQLDGENIPTPRLMKSHLPLQMLPEQIMDQKVKMIYVARNPKDTAVSFFHFYKMDKVYQFKGSWDEFLEMFIAGYVIWGKWFDHVKHFWKLKQEGTKEHLYVTTYEDMHNDPFNTVKTVAEFLEVELDRETISKITQIASFESMKKDPKCNFKEEAWFDLSKGEFMRKGQVGDWKNYFTVAQNEKFDMLYDKEMTDCKWAFVYQ